MWRGLASQLGGNLWKWWALHQEEITPPFPGVSLRGTRQSQSQQVRSQKLAFWGLLLCYVICSIPTLPVYKCTFVLYICIRKQQAKVSSLLAISSK